MRLLILCGAALLVSGCYVYQPLTTSTPPVGTPLRVTLTDAGSSTLTSQVGPRVVTIDGLLQAGGQSQPLVLSVTQTITTDEIEHPWTGEQVTVPREAIATLRERRLSSGRSAFAAAALSGGIIALIKSLQGAFGGGGGTATPPVPGQ